MEQNQAEPAVQAAEEAAEQAAAPKKSKKGLVLIIVLVAVLTAAGVLVSSLLRDRQAETDRLAREADPFYEENGVYDLREADLGTGERLFALNPPVSSIDLTGRDISPEIYDKLRAAYPDAAIRWSVPVGTERIDSGAESVLLPDAEEATLDSLRYFENLKVVDGTQADDTEALIALAKTHPEWEVRYVTDLFGQPVLSTDGWLTLTGLTECDTDLLLSAIDSLPKATDIDLVGVSMTNEQKAALRAARPDIRWYWYVDVGGTRFKSTDEKLDFTRIDFDSFDEFLTVVSCFNAPAYVDVSTQGFANALMDRALERFPGTQFAWILRLGKNFIRTDATVLDLGYGKGERSLRDGDISVLRYCTALEALSLDNQAISDLYPISGLTNLKILCLGSNRISDLTPLKDLANLEYLNLYGNKVIELSPLSGMTKLTDLNLMENDVTSLKPLEGLTSLKRVCLSKNPGLQVKEQTRATEALPGTRFDFSSSSPKVAWQNDPVYDVVDEIFTARQMSPLRPAQ